MSKSHQPELIKTFVFFGNAYATYVIVIFMLTYQHLSVQPLDSESK
jgi:hypothetical protein